MMNPSQTRQHGYVLLLTLVMVALVAAGTVGLTRSSLASATEAKRAEASLQRRWAALSCRHVLLEQAPTFLENRWKGAIKPEEDTEVSDATPVSVDRADFRLIRQQVRLGEYVIDIRLADEQAKANVNTLMEQFGRDQATTELATLTAAMNADLVFDLKPYKADNDPDSTEQLLHLNRVFEEFQPDMMFTRGTAKLPVDTITCWGDGRLRLGLASEAALRTLLTKHLDSSRLDQLLELREERPAITVDQAMRAMSLGPSQSLPVRRLLTDTSTCYSMWLTILSEHRTWHELGIYQTRGEPQDRYLTYLW